MEQEEACSPSSSSVTLRQCRICHDEEDGRRSAMESPCACSGSLKVRRAAWIASLCPRAHALLSTLSHGFVLASRRGFLFPVGNL
jgi:hypothetical protein